MTTELKPQKSCPHPSTSPDPGNAQSVHTTEMQRAIKYWREQGQATLGVSPAFPAEQYSIKKNGKVKQKFNGKNPSYLDEQGIPHVIYHEEFQSVLPDQSQIDQFFAHPETGLGILMGHGNKICIDLDLKECDSEEHCHQLAEALLSNDLLKGTDYDRTPNGGYHIIVEVEEVPEFSLWSESLGGKKRGEARGAGEFAVTYPTPGYTAMSRGHIAKIKNLAEIGIYPVRSEPQPKNTQPAQSKPQPSKVNGSKTLQLFDCASKKVQGFFSGNVEKDGSTTIATAARDFYGWENFLNHFSITFSGSADEHIGELAEQLGVSEKLDRMLKNINRADCEPSLVYAKGQDAGFDKISKLLGQKSEKEQSSTAKDEEDSAEPVIEKHFNQIAFEALYEDGIPRISIRGSVHRWVGTHYEKVDDEVEIKRISDFCNTYFEPVNKKQSKYTKATYKSVLDVLNWAKSRLSVDPDLVDPPGLNCADGVLRLIYNTETKRVDRIFIDHSPNLFYTYVSDAVFNKDADRTQAAKLMQCLDADQGEILLRTLAASIDLDTVRKLHGDRCVRALLAYGEGENGKDTIRVVMQRTLAHGVTGVAIAAFKTYDQGKKFPVSPLERSRLNWSSENSGNVVIDEVQSLKQAITGDTLACERKNKDEHDFEPKSVFIFNVNKLPTIVGALHAIQSRYGILSFDKRFTLNPTKPNEVKADPRFKRDPEFIRSEVLPGFLQMLLDAFDRLIAEGIDYSAVDETFDETRKKSSHLHTFCEDLGLGEVEGEEMTIKEVWDMLRAWYLNEGLAHELTDGSLRFHKMEHWSDEPISCAAHVFSRLQQLFPGIERKRTKYDRKIIGLGYVPVSQPKPEPEPDPLQENTIEEESRQVDEQPHPRKKLHDWAVDMAIEQLQDGIWSNGYRVQSIEDDIQKLKIVSPNGQATHVDWDDPNIRPCKTPPVQSHSRPLTETKNGLRIGDQVRYIPKNASEYAKSYNQGGLEVVEIRPDGYTVRCKSGKKWTDWIGYSSLEKTT